MTGPSYRAYSQSCSGVQSPEKPDIDVEAEFKEGGITMARRNARIRDQRVLASLTWYFKYEATLTAMLRDERRPWTVCISDLVLLRPQRFRAA